MPLEGRRIAITGGSRGIGLAIARTLASRGAEIALLARREATLKGARQDILDTTGREALCHRADVTSDHDIKSFTKRLADEWGQLDGLVNNAGYYVTGRFEDIAITEWQQAFAVNVFGPVRLTKELLPLIHRSDRGRIVNIASTAGRWGSLHQSPYNAAKHAVIGFTRCLALELASTAIRVNAICPGNVLTEFVTDELAALAQARGYEREQQVIDEFLSRIPTHEFAAPDDIAEVAAILLDPAVTSITGQAVNVDGGLIMK